MELGYVVALGLEGIGLLGLCAAAVAARAERRARTGGLRHTLGSGRTAAARLGARPAVTVVRCAPSLAGPLAARDALRRAFA